ncbi:MAG: hypothetical protein WC503_00710 [Candidatus Shapirobacteria bacterium]
MANAKFYVKNKDLLEELKLYKESGKMSENLGSMIFDIATNLGCSGRFAGYTYREDMVAEALLTCCKYLYNFNTEKTTNAFAYITTICRNAFLMYLKQQHKHAGIKKELFDMPDYEDAVENELSAIDYTKLK